MKRSKILLIFKKILWKYFSNRLKIWGFCDLLIAKIFREGTLSKQITREDTRPS